MNIKYRILIITFCEVETIFIAQYKMFGIWMNIGKYRNHFFKTEDTYCETAFEAEKRIGLMRKNIKRAISWGWGLKTIRVYEEL